MFSAKISDVLKLVSAWSRGDAFPEPSQLREFVEAGVPTNGHLCMSKPPAPFGSALGVPQGVPLGAPQGLPQGAPQGVDRVNTI